MFAASLKWQEALIWLKSHKPFQLSAGVDHSIIKQPNYNNSSWLFIEFCNWSSSEQQPQKARFLASKSACSTNKRTGNVNWKSRDTASRTEARAQCSQKNHMIIF